MLYVPTLPRVRRPLLLFLAISVFALTVYRAYLQSITMDEADSYFLWAKSFANVEVFHSNNHILNSLLMWISTRVFGVSHLSVRAPALLGAALFICVSYVLCRRLTQNFFLQIALFLCLTCNPIILDFLVVARGYSLANAFLLAAVAILILSDPHKWRPLRAGAVTASLALGMSFVANFSFAFVDAVVYMALVMWAMRSRGGQSVLRILTLCTLPGLLVALLLAGYPLAIAPHWKGELWWGAHSLQEMRDSLIDASLFQPEPKILGTYHEQVTTIAPWLLPVLAGLSVLRLGSLLQEGNKSLRPMLTVAAVILSALGLSWLAFYFVNLSLPSGRTGLYLVTLCTLLVGLLAAAPGNSAASAWLRRAMIVNLTCLVCFFLTCLRVSYFREYIWDADTREVYSVVARLNHQCGIVDFQTGGFYISALNFYREVSGAETFPPFHLDTPEHSPGKQVYVMHGDTWNDFVVREHLTVIYRGERSGVVVAVQPAGGDSWVCNELACSPERPR